VSPTVTQKTIDWKLKQSKAAKKFTNVKSLFEVENCWMTTELELVVGWMDGSKT
jgi:hypothetical protein